jgi:hypothetical protein
MMLPWLGEVAIENLLLIGRQNSANVAHSLPEHLMPAMHIVLPRLHHFEPGIAQDIRDSIALGRRQIELTIHSLDQPTPGHVQVVIPVRHRAQRETNQKARGSNQEAEPDIRPSWQDRSLSLASPVPTGRLLFRKSCSTRVPRTRHLETPSACGSKDMPHWSRTQISPQPRPSGAIDSDAMPRETPMQIAPACLPAKTRDAPVALLAKPVAPSRHAEPAPSVRRRETHGRTSRIPSDVPAARRAAPPLPSCAIAREIPVVLQNNS